MQPYLEDWRVLLQQAGHDPDSLKIITANNSSSNFNNHTYLVEIERRRGDGSWDLALLYRDMDARAFSERADPSSFDIAPPAIEIDTPACWDTLLEATESLHDTLKPVKIDGPLEDTIRSMFG